MPYSPDNIFQFSDNNYVPNNEFNFNSDYSMSSGESADTWLWVTQYLFISGEYSDCNLTVNYFQLDNPYDLTLCVKEFNWEYNNQCGMHLPVGEMVDCDFTVFKNYNYDFEICHDTLGLDFTSDFDDNVPCSIGMKIDQDIKGGEYAHSELDFEEQLIKVPGAGSDKLELNSCDALPNLNLESCQKDLLVSGKNHNFNIMLCAGETNPQPVDFYPHIFSFNQPWNYLCEAITLEGYTGESCLASILSGIKLPTELNYTGEQAHTNYLSLDISLTNAKMNGGEDGKLLSFFTRPAVNFQFNCYQSEDVTFDIYRTLYIEPEIAYTGEEILDDYLVTTPPIRFEYDFESGETLNCALARTVVLIGTMEHGELGLFDLKLDPLIELENPTVESGEELLSVELTDKPAPSMFPRMDSGENGLSYLNVTYAMYPNVYDGSETYVEALNTDTTMRVFFYDGSEGLADLRANNADEFEPVVESGEYGLTSINTQLILYPHKNYTGEESESTFTTLPFSGMIAKGYSGAEGEIPELFEETEYYLSDENGESADASMSREISLYFKSGYTGERCQTESLNLDYILLNPDENFTGEYARLAMFYVTPGPKLELRAYSGEIGASETNILYYPVFYPEIIISSQNMRDGWGGAGGLNFCPTDCCPSNILISTDLVKQGLDFDARPQDREPWGRCGSPEDTQAFFNLTMGVRFFPNVYSGETGQMYMIREYLPFGKMDSSCDNYETDPECGNDGFDDDNEPCLTVCSPLVCEDGRDRDGEPCVHDDLYWLYNRNPMKNRPLKVDYLEPNIVTGEKTIVWWENIAQGEDDFGDFLTANNQNVKVELTLPPLIDIFESGETVITSLSYSDADWKYPFKQNRGGQSAELTGFGSEEYFRFCPGYLLPEGDNVIFDFASPIFTECYGYFTKTGESMSNFDMLTEDGLSPRSKNNDMYARASLTTVGPWLLHATNGQRVRANLSTTVLIKPKRIQADQRATGHFNIYPPQWDMSTGEMSRLAQLSVSLPGISWVTPDGCIENIYNPLTPDGDWDYTYDSYGIAIEFRPYFGKIEAVCDDDVYIYYNILQPEMMANNLFMSEPSFATFKEFTLDFETGEELYVQEYVAPTGEEIFLELTEFESEPLGDFEENRGEQSSWASIEYHTTLYPVVESGTMVECELINGNEPVVEPNILEFS